MTDREMLKLAAKAAVKVAVTVAIAAAALGNVCWMAV